MLPETRSRNADQLDCQHTSGIDVQLSKSQRETTATGKTTNPTATALAILSAIRDLLADRRCSTPTATFATLLAILSATRDLLADRRRSTSARYQSRSSKLMPARYIRRTNNISTATRRASRSVSWLGDGAQFVTHFVTDWASDLTPMT
jgi:hypothetical protein